jgi:hypothetical protein
MPFDESVGGYVLTYLSVLPVSVLLEHSYSTGPGRRERFISTDSEGQTFFLT